MLKNVSRTELYAGIVAAYPNIDRAFAAQYADRLIADTDERLERNLRQWLRGDPISDEYVGNYCLGMVMKIRGTGDLLEAVELLSLYGRDPDAGERLIWRARR